MDKISNKRNETNKNADSNFYAFIDELKRNVDIVSMAQSLSLNVNECGQAMCFNGHDEKTPSLTFYENTQRYYCFGCGASGDVIQLAQEVAGYSFKEAIMWLAGKAEMDVNEVSETCGIERLTKVSDCLSAAADYYQGRLTADNDYLNTRGIGYETAKRFRIGYADERRGLRSALEEKGFDEEIMIASGLIKEDGADFFQNHIVAPILRSGRVVDFYGRCLNGSNGDRHWRLPKGGEIVQSGLFNWNPNATEIILVEGVFDALSLIQIGEPSTVATLGTNGLTDPLLEMFKRSKIGSVYICFDGDGSGIKAALKTVRKLESIGKDVRIIRLPQGEDPNSFLSRKPDADFKALKDEAQTPLEASIEEIKLLETEDEKTKAVTALLETYTDASPLRQRGVIESLSKSLGIGKKTLQEEMDFLVGKSKEKEMDLGEYEEVFDVKLISNALSFVDDKLFITVGRLLKNREDWALETMSWIVSSDQDWFPFEKSELSRRGYFSKSDHASLFEYHRRYSPRTVLDFVEGKRSGNIVTAHKAVREVLTHYLDFSDPNVFDFLTAWIIGTYVHVIFNYYPYIHFNGTKAVGKTKALRLLMGLCFNGTGSASMTPSSQYRLIELTQPTLCLDEAEDLSSKDYSDKRAILLAGYERNTPVFRNRAHRRHLRAQSPQHLFAEGNGVYRRA